jgi:hypothetical protein
LFIALATATFAAPTAKQALPFEAREVTVPFYLGTERQPSLVVKIDHLSNERQRKGFFRIGVLPLLVAHQVELEVRTPENFTNVRQQFHQHLSGKELKNAVELRGFTLTIPSTHTVVTAPRVRMISSDTWELNGPGTVVRDGSTNTFSRALLVTSGPSVGTFRGDRNTTVNLFSKPAS